jgi:hypothetical protein
MIWVVLISVGFSSWDNGQHSDPIVLRIEFDDEPIFPDPKSMKSPEFSPQRPNILMTKGIFGLAQFLQPNQNARRGRFLQSLKILQRRARKFNAPVFFSHLSKR